MSKTIKLEDEVYQRLDAQRMVLETQRQKRTTFSEAVDYLITIKQLVGTLASQVSQTGTLAVTTPQSRELHE